MWMRRSRRALHVVLPHARRAYFNGARAVKWHLHWWLTVAVEHGASAQGKHQHCLFCGLERVKWVRA